MLDNRETLVPLVAQLHNLPLELGLSLAQNPDIPLRGAQLLTDSLSKERLARVSSRPIG